MKKSKNRRVVWAMVVLAASLPVLADSSVTSSRGSNTSPQADLTSLSDDVYFTADLNSAALHDALPAMDRPASAAVAGEWSGGLAMVTGPAVVVGTDQSGVIMPPMLNKIGR